jgi:hypothetical protein
MKQFEYLTHSPDFIREVRRDGRGQRFDYDELQELGRQGWELVTAQPGGKWIFKRELAEGPKPEHTRPEKPLPDGFGRGR